jgi:hypothetical protein
MSQTVTGTFQQQVDRLVELGYPGLAATTETDFRELLEPLREAAEALPDQDRDETIQGRTSYVVVVTRDLVRPEDTVPLLRLTGPRGPGERPGRVDRNHGEGDLGNYHPIEASTPPAAAYLLLGVERGEEFCDVRPEEATAVVLGRGRSPLTIDEGIALVTHRPDLLEKNKCFMLAGSRRSALPGDRRVPALWISERAPKLGWCWAGNPHTWLGLASAGGRVA